VISIIIPCYRVKLEDIVIQLDSLIDQDEECEVIFSDGEKDYFNSFIPSVSSMLYGSLISLKIVQNKKSHTVLTRGESMNLGAKNAIGDILLFLHLDTILPKNALKVINSTMKEEKFVGGGFLKRYDAGFFLRITKTILNIRVKLFKRMVGTNAIFVRKSIFNERSFSEGFLEDVDYSDYLLEKYSKNAIVIIPDYISVSSAKYIKNGVIKRVLINGLIMFLYRFKYSEVQELETIYKKSNSLCDAYKTAYHIIFKSKKSA